ncbi:MAG: GNAT family N-acetyltransferase [Fimbriimonadaceae bacterium]
MIQIRKTVPDADYLRICEINNQFDPEPIVAESYLPKMKVVPKGWQVLRLTGLVDGEIVGFAHLRRNSGMFSDTFLLTLAVDEVHQGRGYGAALLDSVLEQAPEMGARRIVPIVRETHARAPKFFESRGFDTKMSLREGYLELEDFEAEIEELPEGYHLVRWSDIEDNEENREKFAVAFLKMDADEPGSLLLGGFDRETIERDAFDADTSDPRYLYLVECDGEWVAHHQIQMNEPGDWEMTGITFTGTLPAHRRLGLATALKNLGALEAKELGAKRIMTHNDSSNLGMLTINRKQGYVEEPGWLMMLREL